MKAFIALKSYETTEDHSRGNGCCHFQLEPGQIGVDARTFGSRLGDRDCPDHDFAIDGGGYRGSYSTGVKPFPLSRAGSAHFG